MLEFGDRSAHFHKIDKEWYWRLKNKNGDLIARSERGFSTKEACIDDLQRSIGQH